MANDASELTLRLRQQALLAELGRRALSHLEFDALLEEACRLTALGLNIRFSKALEYLPDQNRLLVRAGVGWHEGVVGHATLNAELASPAGYALHTGKPVISNELATERRFQTPDLLAEHGVQRAANVILLGEGRPFGVLEADSEAAGAFTEHDIDFLQGMANMLGLALERRRAEDELRRLNEDLEQRIEREVAERRQAEVALQHMQKMEAIGQLTGGVAHDFNNLLMVISGNLDLLARTVPGNEQAHNLVTTAQKAANRGAQLTSQLLAFARRQTLRPESRPINELVREFDVLMSRVLGDSIQIDFVLDPTAGACHTDSAQFGSALLNLAINGRDAMPAGGQMTVRTGTVVLDQLTAARHPNAQPGTYVVVEVADQGAGMPPDVLERATEPFFTTKELGRGTGLGLSQVHGFVLQSGGFMTLQSTVGQGTTVRLHFPQVLAEACSSPPTSVSPASGSGTVLVVEDDSDVRDLLLALLEDLGYATLAAASGPEALEVLQRPETRVDVLLTDMVMPGGMTGVELVHAARAQRPELRAILTSGYLAGNIEAAAPGDNTGDKLPVLSKPYQQEELARVIAQALR